MKYDTAKFLMYKSFEDEMYLMAFYYAFLLGRVNADEGYELYKKHAAMYEVKVFNEVLLG